MTELTKTLVFLAVALIAVFVGIVAGRPAATIDPNAAAAGLIFPELADESDARPSGRLSILSVNERTFERTQLELKKNKDGLWVLPLKSDYPADAASQVADATVALQQLERFDVATTDPAKYPLYGVVDPEKSEAGETGVGTLVRLEDETGNALAELIVGKEDPDRSSLRFVRKPSESAVFRADVNMSKFPTDVEKWIDRKLIDIVQSNVKDVRLQKNSFQLNRETGRFEFKELIRAELAYESAGNKWTLATYRTFENETGEPIDESLAADEELNADNLGKMLSALTSLEIVDVTRRFGPFLKRWQTNVPLGSFDQSGLLTLLDQGFAPVGRKSEDGEGVELQPGEALVSLGANDGVRYTLYFGSQANANTAPQNEDDQKGSKGDPNAKGEKAEPIAEKHRYLMIAASFDETLLKEPEYEPEPDAAGEPADEESDKAAEGDAAKTEGEQEDSAEAPKKEAPKKEVESKEEETKKEQADAKSKDRTAKSPEEIKLDDIRKRNKSKKEAYEKQIADAEKKVSRFNRRCGDWVYRVADENFQKIDVVGRDKLVRAVKPAEGEKAETEKAPDAFKSEELKEFKDLQEKTP